MTTGPGKQSKPAAPSPADKKTGSDKSSFEKRTVTNKSFKSASNDSIVKGKIVPGGASAKKDAVKGKAATNVYKPRETNMISSRAQRDAQSDKLSDKQISSPTVIIRSEDDSPGLDEKREKKADNDDISTKSNIRSLHGGLASINEQPERAGEMSPEHDPNRAEAAAFGDNVEKFSAQGRGKINGMMELLSTSTAPKKPPLAGGAGKLKRTKAKMNYKEEQDSKDDVDDNPF